MRKERGRGELDGVGSSWPQLWQLCGRATGDWSLPRLGSSRLNLAAAPARTVLTPAPLHAIPRSPLRVIYALHKARKLAPNCQLVIITSQAGSAEWRKTQNADAGGDYGHHMSRAACNIAGKFGV